MEVKYRADGKEIILNPDIVQKSLVQGGVATEGELTKFIMLCKYQELNPFLGDAYLVKTSEGAIIMVGKDVHLKRAQKNPKFKGVTSGVVVRVLNGETQYRVGGLVSGGEVIEGGWAEVRHADWAEPYMVVVNLREYMKMKNGHPQRSWAKMPATMIIKVAMAQALRTVFPTELRGLYSEEEMGVEPEKIENVDHNTMPETPETVLKDKPDVVKPEIVKPEIKSEDEIRIRLGKTPAEQIRKSIFRTSMLYHNDGKATDVVILGAKGNYAKIFAELPGGSYYKCRLMPLSPKALEQVSFKASLKNYNSAQKFWVRELKEGGI